MQLLGVEGYIHFQEIPISKNEAYVLTHEYFIKMDVYEALGVGECIVKWKTP